MIMARLQGSCTITPTSITGGTPQTLYQLIAPTNQRLAVQKIILSADGTNSANSPMTITILRQSTAGTFTNGSVAPFKVNDPSGTLETLQGVYQTVITTPGSGEPTAGNILEEFTMPVFGGFVEKPYPLLQELMVYGGSRLGVKVAAAQTVNVTSTLIYEE
jgi:hypothetical protein